MNVGVLVARREHECERTRNERAFVARLLAQLRGEASPLGVALVLAAAGSWFFAIAATVSAFSNRLPSNSPPLRIIWQNLT